MDAASQVGNEQVPDAGGQVPRAGQAGDTPTGAPGPAAALGSADGIGWAFAVGLALAALFVPGVVRGALFLVAGLVATVTGSPRWLGVLLVTAGVPILLVALVTGTVWFG